MNGTITFNSLQEVAAFLKEFTGSTATFEVFARVNGRGDNDTQWVLEFKGGY